MAAVVYRYLPDLVQMGFTGDKGAAHPPLWTCRPRPRTHTRTARVRPTQTDRDAARLCHAEACARHALGE
eukprot:COSAG06_NODE_39022_length_417_cov_0.880503_1_plen_69_part_01